jgi:hypothetical protein
MEILCFLHVLSAENELVWSAVNKIAFFICHMYLSFVVNAIDCGLIYPQGSMDLSL